MHILMLLDHNYPPDPRVENEAKSLVEAGFEVTVLSIGSDNRPNQEMHNGVRVIRFPMPMNIKKKLRGTVGFFDLYTPKLIKAAKQVFSKYKIDTVHVHDLYLGRVGIKLKNIFKVPLVIDLHENYVHALSQYSWSTRFPGSWLISIEKWKQLELEWLKKADAIVTVIAEMKDRYLELGFEDWKIIVTPNTPNLDAFREYPIKEEIISKYPGKKVLLYSGGFDLHRGLSTTVAAMPKVLKKHPEAILVLVGTGRNHHELELQAGELGISQYVVFEGWQDQSNIRSFIRRADIGLIPHVKSVQTDASIPHKLGYYMSEKLPVITTNCTSLERMVKKHNAGLIFESQNSKELANCINHLLDNPEIAMQLGNNGKTAAETTFNWSITVQPLIEYYRSMA